MFKTLMGKLLAVFLIFSLLCLFIIIVQNYVSHKKDKIILEEDLLNSINESALRKFNTVADFFSFDTRNVRFFETGKSVTLNKIDSLDKVISSELKSVSKSKNIDEFYFSKRISDINKGITTHQIIFNVIKEDILKRGYADFGYVGRMRNSFYKVEKSRNVDLVLLATIRRNERDYILRYEDRYIDTIKFNVDKLHTEINHNLTLNRIEKDAALDNLNKYLAYFDSTVVLNKKIGLKDNTALYLKLNEIEDVVENELDVILNLERLQQRKLFESLNYSFLIISLFLVLASIVLSYFISKKVLKPVLLLSQSCQEFVTSGFETKGKCEIGANDMELKRLIANFEILKIEITGLLFEFKQKVEERTQTIEKQNNELRELNATKDVFFSIIAHDLRSPFNAILGTTEVLMDKINKLDHKKIEYYCSSIKESADQTLILLENLLEWSRIQRGQIHPDVQENDLFPIVEEVNKLSQKIAAQKKITLLNTVHANLNVKCDVNITKTVLRNLISNAIKYTPSGGTISINAVSRDDHIEVEVHDNGVGIPPEKITKLFRIEKNISTKGTANESGSGIGLLLCKELLEKQGSQIWVVSKVNEGSSFYFTLPRETNN